MKKVLFLTNLIDNYLKENKISKTKFCKECKINYSVLQKIYNQQTNFDIIYLFRLVKILNIEILDFIFEI